MMLRSTTLTPSLLQLIQFQSMQLPCPIHRPYYLSAADFADNRRCSNKHSQNIKYLATIIMIKSGHNGAHEHTIATLTSSTHCNTIEHNRCTRTCVCVWCCGTLVANVYAHTNCIYFTYPTQTDSHTQFRAHVAYTNTYAFDVCCKIIELMSTSIAALCGKSFAHFASRACDAFVCGIIECWFDGLVCCCRWFFFALLLYPPLIPTLCRCWDLWCVLMVNQFHAQTVWRNYQRRTEINASSQTQRTYLLFTWHI